MYHKAIKIMNQEAKNRSTVFNHIMTVSNHRPLPTRMVKLTFLAMQSRDGGVKYTDYNA
jgi:phosphoglycerol transferase MdoB-like AlkP superfamily enzyme